MNPFKSAWDYLFGPTPPCKRCGEPECPASQSPRYPCHKHSPRPPATQPKEEYLTCPRCQYTYKKG